MRWVVLFLALAGSALAQQTAPTGPGTIGDLMGFCSPGLAVNSTIGVPCDTGAPLVLAPGGRLVSQSGVSAETTDQTGVATIYYAQFRGGYYVPVWNGSLFKYLPIGLSAGTPTLSLANNTNFPTTTLFDIYAFNNAGALGLCAVPYSSSAAGSSTRTVALNTSVTGLATNATVPANCYNGATNYGSGGSNAVAVNQGTWLGVVYTTAAGQTTVHVNQQVASGGGNAIVGLCNYYNPLRRRIRSLDSAALYSVTGSAGGAVGASMADAGATGAGANNRITFTHCGLSANGTSGLTGQQVMGFLAATGFATNTTTYHNDWIFLNANSGTPNGGSASTWTTSVSVTGGGGNASIPVRQVVEQEFLPSVGLNYAQWMQSCLSTGAASCQYWGGSTISNASLPGENVLSIEFDY